MSTFEFDVLRQQLVTQVIQAAQAMNLPIKLPNAPFNQPTDGTVWAEFQLLMGKSGPAELGGGDAALERTCSILQFDVLAPVNTGDGPALRVANELKRRFNKITVQCGAAGYFRTDVIGIQTAPSSKRGFYRLCVDGGLDFFHRNPDAVRT